MGKQKQLKKLKRMAKELPAETETRTESITATGRELLAKGITRVRGKGPDGWIQVKPRQTYSLRGEVTRPVNHADKMKQAYQEQGPAGVASYLKQYLPTDKTTTA